MTDQISMSNETQTLDKSAVTAAPSNRASKRSAAAKLLQAAALAAALVPLGSVAAEASTCHFGGSGTCFDNSEGFTQFGFTDPGYVVGLRFDTIVGEFDVMITATELTEAQALARMVNFPGFRPVPIGSNPAMPYIDFNVTAPTPCFQSPSNDCSTASNTWISQGPRGPAADQGYDIRIYWTANTDGLFPDPHVLHATGDSEVYDIDISDGSYDTFVPCDVFGTCGIELFSATDPAVGGRDDMFTTFGLGDPSAVPEPATLLLLGSGISGLMYRRRRK